MLVYEEKGAGDCQHFSPCSQRIMFSVLLVFCVGYAAGQTCQQAGSVCYRVTSQPVGVVGGQCCDSCRPYLPNGGNTWDGTTDWFCQYANGGTEGQSCVGSGPA